MLTLLKSFDSTFSDVKFDKKLAKQIYLYRVGLVTRSRDHMEFFGGNLLGTHSVWFKDVYVTELFEGILDTPYDLVEANTRKVTTINHTFKISGDIMNLTLMYLIHAFARSPHLSDKERDNAMHDVAMIFFYRCLCIIISDQFSFKADAKVAQQAYANLSMKFLIKKLGTWNKVIDYRAKALVNKRESIHWRALYSFNNDEDIVYAINDSQGRIKGIVKEYYSELMIVAQGGGSVAVTAAIGVDMEGEESVREKPQGPEAMILYTRSILLDKSTFVRDDLLEVVARTNSNTSRRSVHEVLVWMSEESIKADVFRDVDAFITKTLVLCAYFMDNNIDYKRRRDYVYVMKTLKDLFIATRSVDPDLLEVRELGSKLIERSFASDLKPGEKAPKISNSLLLATRTAVILYICLLALNGGKR